MLGTKNEENDAVLYVYPTRPNLNSPALISWQVESLFKFLNIQGLS